MIFPIGANSSCNQWRRHNARHFEV